MGYEIDFLPVGDGENCGDAIVLRFGNLYGLRHEQRVIVIDGGFKDSGEKLVDHLRRHYGTDAVDLVISTHPDADHASGLEVVLTGLNVGRLWLHLPWNHTFDIARMFRDGRVTDNSVREALRRSLDNARELERLAMQRQIPIDEPFTGLTDDTGCVTVVGPTRQYYESLLPAFRGTPESAVSILQRALQAAGKIATTLVELWNVETLTDDGETTAENNSSAIILLRFGGDSILLTADAGIPALTQAVLILDNAGFDYGSIRFIQVPHHGSRRNVGPTLLNRLLGPKLPEPGILRYAVAAVATEGAPKHPAKKVTNAFLRRGAPVCVTAGKTIRYDHEAPPREGWVPMNPLPFYEQVEE